MTALEPDIACSIVAQRSDPALSPKDQKPAMARIRLRERLFICNLGSGGNLSARRGQAKDGKDYEAQDGFPDTLLVDASISKRTIEAKRNQRAQPDLCLFRASCTWLTPC